jgi:hypothetical protein
MDTLIVEIRGMETADRRPTVTRIPSQLRRFIIYLTSNTDPDYLVGNGRVLLWNSSNTG